MNAVPLELIDPVPLADRQLVEEWWAGLGEDARAEVAALCDPRVDESFFGVTAEGPAPVVIGGKFIPSDDAAGWTEWHAELFDYLLNHPELVFVPLVIRTFHIGCAHHVARAARKAGRIPADFECPLGRRECPMRRLLDLSPDHALQLTRITGRILPLELER